MKRLFDKDTWQEIFGSIQKNKIRTIITMIGVLWGIFIYIALSASISLAILLVLEISVPSRFVLLGDIF